MQKSNRRIIGALKIKGGIMAMNLAESYIKNLKAQCGVFSADEAERAIDELTKK